LEITTAESNFILDRLDKLPGKKDHESPIWMSAFDKKIQVRAYEVTQQSGIALELSHSGYTGHDVTGSMNRAFLKNALQFGCHRIAVAPKDDPFVCSGEDKTFVFTPLTNKEPEYDTSRFEVVTSASVATTTATTATKVASTTPTPVKRRRRRTVKANTAKPSTTGKAALLVQAEEVRQALRTTLGQVNDLIREVKAQRNKDKLIQNTMDSLRKLNLNIV
jgi:hypothetical protein